MSETQENESQRKAREHKAEVKKWNDYAKAIKSRNLTDFEKSWQKHLEPQLVVTGVKYALWIERGHAVTCDLTGVRGGDQDSALERAIETANQWSYIEREIVSEHGTRALACTRTAVLSGTTATEMARAGMVSVSRADAKAVLGADKSFGQRINVIRQRYAIRIVEASLQLANDIWTDAGRDRYVGPKVARGEAEEF